MRNKLVPIILIVAVLGFVGFMTTGCSTSDDESTLELYVFNIDPLDNYYKVGASTCGPETKVTISCVYYGDSEVAPKGVFINRITLIAQNSSEVAIVAVDDKVIYTSYFIPVGEDNIVIFGDITWLSLRTWLDAQTPTGTEEMVIKIYIEGEDTSGNTLNAVTYFTVFYY
ncbi:hypothetical protein KAU32_05985 [bacterium]|nr:hypothetical protein [bacterium]